MVMALVGTVCTMSKQSICQQSTAAVVICSHQLQHSFMSCIDFKVSTLAMNGQAVQIQSLACVARVSVPCQACQCQMAQNLQLIQCGAGQCSRQA